ncbi:MAG: tripartite tricarboxylate transporter permease [Thermoanaerobaculia bacterium]|nr:tripartite tricarboxylate transporter permease [Thermoanaerobaculia bacterium]
MIEGLLAGLATLARPVNLGMVVLGCASGTFIGMLPGLGPITAIALLIPLTYGLEPASALILMAGVYYGAVFGGSTSSILLNAPGVAGTVATTFDGHPLARQGKAGKALAVAAYASFSGGTLAALLLLFAAPALASVALGFHSPDYFAVSILALTSVSAFAARGHLAKAVLMTVLGLMLATVGQDVASDVPRFTFGSIELLDGISFLLLAMATFAMSEAFLSVLQGRGAAPPPPTAELASLRVSRAEAREVAPPIARASALGFFVGVLPGAGATIASFLAYAMERSLAPLRERDAFGRGSLRGLAAPEAANNAACSGSFVPLLTLGIPGSGTTAVMLGALISAGVQPGPRLLVDRPDVFWSVIVSMYLGNVLLLVLNLPLIPWLARILLVPKGLLVPLILFFSVLGVYAVSLSAFDVVLMIAIALAATLLRLLDYPLPPLILGFVLGPLMEENLRRSLILYDDSLRFLWQRPTTAAILVATLAILAGRGVSVLRARRRPAL